MYSSKTISVEPTEVSEPNLDDPYLALWCGVVNQAYMDAKNGPEKVYVDCDSRQEYTERSMFEAKRFESYWKQWLSSDDFFTVCWYSNIDPELLKEKLQEEAIASCARYINGIDMRYTKILRKITAAAKLQASQWQQTLETK